MGGVSDEVCSGLYFAAVFVEVVAITAVASRHEEEDIDTAGKNLEFSGSVGHTVTDCVVGHKVSTLRQMSLYVLYQLPIFFTAFGGLGIETYGTLEIDGTNIVRTADDDGSTIGLACETHHLGMSGLAEDDNLSADVPHLVVALADTLLESQDDGTCGIDQFNAQLTGSDICRRGLSMSPDKHLAASQVRQHVVINNLQTFVSQAFHLGTVVNDITQTIETTFLSKDLLGGTDGFHHSEAIARIVINPYIHN